MRATIALNGLIETIEIKRNIDLINPFPPSIAFHIETRNLFYSAKQMTAFYMKRYTGLKWFNV